MVLSASQLEGVALALRIYTCLCGFMLIAIGAVSVGLAPSRIASLHGSSALQESISIVLVAALEMACGTIVVAGEFHISCLARFFGFVATPIGKSMFLLLAGALVLSLGSVYLNVSGDAELAPALIGLMVVAAGVLHGLCGCPCCPIPADPLRVRFLAMASPPRVTAVVGGSREVAPPVGPEDSMVAPRRGMFSKVGRQDTLDDESSAHKRTTKGERRRGGASRVSGVSGVGEEASSQHVAINLQTGPSDGVSKAEENPFYANRHLTQQR